MKNRFLLSITVILASGPVHAGSYTEAAELESLCSLVGKTTAVTYRNRMSGVSKEQAIEQAIQQWGENPTKMQKAPVVIAYDMATDERDAYRRGWAYCMDQQNQPKPKAKK